MTFNEKWTVTVEMNREIKQQYKFIVDGKWTLDDFAPKENDGRGNVNNWLAPLQKETSSSSLTTTTSLIASSPTTSFTTSIPSSSSTNPGTNPTELPGCQNYNGKDSCQGQQTEYDISVEERRWQTPSRNSSDYVSSYQDYSDLTGYASFEYSNDRKSAVVTVKAFTRDPNAVVLVSFNGGAATTTNTFQATSDMKEDLTIKLTIANTVQSLTLDPLNFLWQNNVVNSNFDGTKGAIVELLGWPYKDIAQECVFLGKAGYTGVRIWPANEHIQTDKWLGENNEINNWYYVYQPVSYRLHSRMGTRDELRSMIQICRSHGVRIYADAAFNQMTGGGNDVLDHRNQKGNFCETWGGKEATAGSPYYTPNWTYKINQNTGKRAALEFPAVPYGPSDFHCERAMTAWQDPFQLQFGWLSGLADLNTGKPYVQERIADFLVDLLSIGFSGFRIDAAKHIGPNHLAKIFSILKRKLGGSDLPSDFIAWLEVLIGGEKDLLCCNPGPYNWYTGNDELMKKAGLSDNDIYKVKMWSADYPKEMPICGNWILPPSRFLVQNDDHDQMFGGSPRDMQSFGSVLATAKDVNSHRNFEVNLFNRRDHDWKFRAILSGFSFTEKGAKGFPDGKSDCKIYKGNQSSCNSVPRAQAFVAESCGYFNGGVFKSNSYSRVHRDLKIVNAMRNWMGLNSVGPSELGLPNHCQ
ncbi:hypothetical protein HDU92_000443 [Lobulomyces angularis]|nr:hypothetical protein HDU92_000443 [Lobulomyces angularis]